MDNETETSAISKHRLETLVDGVFAIAMTILVLELRVPELADERSVPELGQALQRQIPTVLSYVLSFLVLGAFWYRHNVQARHFRVINRGMLALQFVQLAAAASFPFFAALLGRYGPNPLSPVAYGGCILVYARASSATWILAKRSGCMSEALTPAEYRRSKRRGLLLCAIVSVVFAVYLGRLFIL